MFPKNLRLSKERDVKRVLRGGRRYSGKFFRAVNLPNPTTRATFVVSVKVDKRSTKRNRMKRRIREIFHRTFTYEQLQRSCDYVIFPDKFVLGADHQDLEKDVRSFFRKIGVL